MTLSVGDVVQFTGIPGSYKVVSVHAAHFVNTGPGGMRHPPHAVIHRVRASGIVERISICITALTLLWTAEEWNESLQGEEANDPKSTPDA